MDAGYKKAGLIGAALAIPGFVQSLHDGATVFDSVITFPIGALMAMAILYWWRNRNSERQTSSSSFSQGNDVHRLQRELTKAVQASARYQAQGNQEQASWWRAEAAVIESRLRNIGA